MERKLLSSKAALYEKKLARGHFLTFPPFSPNDRPTLNCSFVIFIRNDLEIHETRNISDRNRRFGASWHSLMQIRFNLASSQTAFYL